MEENNKIIKEVKINGVRVKLELSKEKARDFPEKLESTIKIEDKEVEPISLGSIFF